MVSTAVDAMRFFFASDRPYCIWCDQFHSVATCPQCACSSSAHECTLVLVYSFRLLYFYCERGLLSSSAHDCLTLMEDIDSEDDVSLYHGLRIRRVTVAVSNVVCQRCNYNVKFETLLYNTREFGFAHGENCRTRNASRSFEKHFFVRALLTNVH